MPPYRAHLPTIPTGLRPLAQGWTAQRRPTLGPPQTNPQPQRGCVPVAIALTLHRSTARRLSPQRIIEPNTWDGRHQHHPTHLNALHLRPVPQRDTAYQPRATLWVRHTPPRSSEGTPHTPYRAHRPTIPTGLRLLAQGWTAQRRPTLGPPQTNPQPQRGCVPDGLDTAGGFHGMRVRAQVARTQW
jgi:hypothetical protein